MDEIVKIVLSLSLSGSLLILVLLLCKPLFKNRISKCWQYYIWLVAIARLLLPFTPEASPMGTLFQEVDRAIVQTHTASDSTPNRAPASQSGNDTMIKTEAAPQNWQTDAAPMSHRFYKVLMQNLRLVWLAVALILLIRKITIYQSFVKYIKAGRTEVSDTAILDRLALIGKQAGVKRPVELYTNSLISSPLLLGFFQPCIVLPTADLSEVNFQYTILHELTHYKRRDMFYKWLVQFANCLHWFNPLVYLMGREVGRACELACDEAVVTVLDPQGRRAYGDTLLNAIGAGGGYRDSLASVTLNESKELLKERLAAIMNFKKKSKLSVAISMFLVLVFGGGASLVGAYAATPHANPNDIYTTLILSNNAVWDLGQVSRWDICVESENVIVQRGGASFQIAVSPESKDNYLLLDDMHVITARFQEREIVLQRKKDLGAEAVYSPVIIVTVPESATNVLNTINTTSGNISIDNSQADKISAVSETGAITISNSFAADYIIAESIAGTVTLANTTCDGEIFVKDKDTSKVSDGGGDLSKSGYSEEEFAVLLKIAENYAFTIAQKENLGTPQYVGELFDLDAVKGIVSINFDLDGSKYTTLAVDINSDGEVIGHDYWDSPD